MSRRRCYDRSALMHSSDIEFFAKFNGYEPAADFIYKRPSYIGKSYKRLSLWDMSRLRCLYIWDMSRRQYIRKITKSKGYEPAMVNMGKLM